MVYCGRCHDDEGRESLLHEEVSRARQPGVPEVATVLDTKGVGVAHDSTITKRCKKCGVGPIEIHKDRLSEALMEMRGLVDESGEVVRPDQTGTRSLLLDPDGQLRPVPTPKHRESLDEDWKRRPLEGTAGTEAEAGIPGAPTAEEHAELSRRVAEDEVELLEPPAEPGDQIGRWPAPRRPLS